MSKIVQYFLDMIGQNDTLHWTMFNNEPKVAFFQIFFINSVSIRENNYQSGDFNINSDKIIINSVSIRFRELSFRYLFGDVIYQSGEMFREIPRD